MENVVQENKRLKQWLAGVLIALIVILLFLLLVLAHDYRRAKAIESVETTQSSLSAERKVKGPLSKVEVGDISSWMTFDYVNYLFGLPPGYLKTAVPINDSSYPHLSLNSYAHYVDESRTALVTNIQNAVAAYLNANASSTAQ